MEKIPNQKAWFLVLPVFALVAFSAVIPLMTVVNYSVQDTFGNNKFFWNGIGWYQELLDPATELGGRFFASLWRNLAFSAIALAIEIPLGIVIALAMPREGWGVAFSLVVLALPLLIPWNVVGTIWQIFGRSDIGLLGYTLNWLGLDYNYVANPIDAWLTIIAMDVWHWSSLVALLCYAGLKSIPEAFYQAASHRRRVALGGVPGDPAAQDEARPADRRTAALHGFLHDLYRAVRRDRRRSGQFDDLPVDRAGQAGARPVRPRQGRGDVDRLHADHHHRVLGLLHGDDQCRRGSRAGRRRAVMYALPGRRVILALFIVFLLLPIYWLINMSFKTNVEITSTMTLWPLAPTLANYRVIFTDPSWYLELPPFARSTS